MEKYISPLLADFSAAAQNVSRPFVWQDSSLHDWIPPDEERTAPECDLEEWTGILKEQLLTSGNALRRATPPVVKCFEGYA